MVNQSKPIVAIFGGSFDPPHSGHQQIVRHAIDTLEIDHLLLIPAYLNPFKSFSFASPEQRLDWCHRLFDNVAKVIVSDYEIKEEKSTRTSQAVKYFSKQYSVKYLIVGADNLATLTQWYDFSYLNEYVTWVIVTREGHPLNTSILRRWKLLTLDEMMSSSQIRDKNDLHYVDNKIKKSVQNVLNKMHFKETKQ